MEVRMSTKKETQGFTEEELAAMKERVKELKAEASQSKGSQKAKAQGESDVLEKIAEMAEPDRSMAARLYELIKDTVPDLWPKTWYGMPAFAKDGKVICFFQSGDKFKTRYSTLGFSDTANLDDGDMWPTSYAVQEWNEAVEAKIIDLVKQAVSEG